VVLPAPSQLCLLAALGLFVSSGRAQSAPAAEKAEPLPPVFTAAAAASPAAPAAPGAKTGATAAATSHAISPDLAATISTALPQYQDPSAQLPPPPAAGDKPRNEIPRLLPFMLLPQVTVRERPIREFTERESYTRKGLEELAVKRYLSDFDRYFLNRFTLPIVGVSKEARAMQLFDQDEAIARNKEMGELWKLDAIKDPTLDPAPAKAP
jgi:hypothetical protein